MTTMLPNKKTNRNQGAAKSAESSSAAPEVKTERELRMGDRLNWPAIVWLVMLHVGALAAPFTFTWKGLALALFMHWMTGCVGVCLGFHRLLTHTSFKTYGPVRWMLGLIGGLAGEGSAIDWVSNHRKHHAHSDQDGDPHSPLHGAWWSHAYWLAFTRQGKLAQEHAKRWTPDLVRDRGMRMLSYLFLPSNIALGFAFAALGWWWEGPALAASFVVWGMFVRFVAVLHVTWAVNSASHMWGYRNYETTDVSRNNWIVAILAYGEGWHNNHHAYPRLAAHGHKWWEFDMTFTVIRLMQMLGLAWDIVDYKRKGSLTPMDSTGDPIPGSDSNLAA